MKSLAGHLAQWKCPTRLRTRIVARLAEERGQRGRRWPVYSLRGALAAAALLLLAVGLWRWSLVLPPFPADAWRRKRTIGLSCRRAASKFRRRSAQGADVTAPADLNYNYVRFLFLANVEGRPTPTLLFNNKDKGGASGFSQHALVYIVSDSQFDTDALPVDSQTGNGYEYKCFIRPPGPDHSGYVAYYTGDDLNWLACPP